MKKIIWIFMVSAMLISPLWAAYDADLSQTEVRTNIRDVKSVSTLPNSIINAVNSQWGEIKWFFGTIISNIFNLDGRIKNIYVDAFTNVLWNSSNNQILKWSYNGTSNLWKFIASSISEDGSGNVRIGSSTSSKNLRVYGDIVANNVTDPSGNQLWGKFIDGTPDASEAVYAWNVGIGTPNPNERLSVNGRISISTDPNTLDDVWDVWYNDARYIRKWESWDFIQDNTIDSTEIENYSISDIDIRDNTIVRSIAGVSLVWPRAWKSWNWNDDGTWIGHNMFLWHYSWYNITSGSNNIALWQRSWFANTTGYNNTFVWLFSGSDNTTGNQNTFIWLGAGTLNTTWWNNIALWAYSRVPNPSGSNQISIWNRIYGVSNWNIWISTDTPTQRLDVNGKIRMRSQTVSTDAADTVATKGYVDNKSLSKKAVGIFSQRRSTSGTSGTLAWNGVLSGTFTVPSGLGISTIMLYCVNGTNRKWRIYLNVSDGDQFFWDLSFSWQTRIYQWNNASWYVLSQCLTTSVFHGWWSPNTISINPAWWFELVEDNPFLYASPYEYLPANNTAIGFVLYK